MTLSTRGHGVDAATKAQRHLRELGHQRDEGGMPMKGVSLVRSPGYLGRQPVWCVAQDIWATQLSESNRLAVKDR